MPLALEEVFGVRFEVLVDVGPHKLCIPDPPSALFTQLDL